MPLLRASQCQHQQDSGCWPWEPPPHTSQHPAACGLFLLPPYLTGLPLLLQQHRGGKLHPALRGRAILFLSNTQPAPATSGTRRSQGSEHDLPTPVFSAAPEDRDLFCVVSTPCPMLAAGRASLSSPLHHVASSEGGWAPRCTQTCTREHSGAITCSLSDAARLRPRPGSLGSGPQLGLHSPGR